MAARASSAPILLYRRFPIGPAITVLADHCSRLAQARRWNTRRPIASAARKDFVDSSWDNRRETDCLAVVIGLLAIGLWTGLAARPAPEHTAERLPLAGTLRFAVGRSMVFACPGLLAGQTPGLARWLSAFGFGPASAWAAVLRVGRWDAAHRLFGQRLSSV